MSGPEKYTIAYGTQPSDEAVDSRLQWAHAEGQMQRQRETFEQTREMQFALALRNCRELCQGPTILGPDGRPARGKR